MVFLEKFRVRDLGVLRIDLHRKSGVVDGSFHAIEITHQKNLQRVWIFLREGTGDTGTRPDDTKSLFVIIDNDRKAFTARHFTLWRGYNQPIGIASKKNWNRRRRRFLVEERAVLSAFLSALLFAFSACNFT